MQYVKYVIAFIIIAGLVYAGLVAMDAFTPEAFSLLSAALIAVIFERFKFLQDDFNKLSEDMKRLVMFIFMAVLVYGAFGLSCAGSLGAFPCTGQGALNALMVLIFAITTNQGVYLIAKRGK